MKNEILERGIVDIGLSEEQVEALRCDRDLLQDILSMRGADAITTLWIVCLNVVDDVPGRSSPPIAALPAAKGVTAG